MNKIFEIVTLENFFNTAVLISKICNLAIRIIAAAGQTMRGYKGGGYFCGRCDLFVSFLKMPRNKLHGIKLY